MIDCKNDGKELSKKRKKQNDHKGREFVEDIL